MADFNPTSIIIDGNNANKRENYLYRGTGMVSANNSSRLLIDYKYKNPNAYQKILNFIFGADGIRVEHLKIEMGSDINSSSGTEPATKRYDAEECDVTRGAGFILAKDAKEINPDLTLDMLWWSEPKWITDSADVYAARYKWYKENLDSAYKTYGLKFEYVSTTQNERAYDKEWIKYLSKRLRSETDCPYDYSRIKLVAGDEVCTWNIADEMLCDNELLKAIDVVGSHYTSFSTDNAKKLAEEYKKELWFSEASTSMVYAQRTHKYDSTGSGLNDINGILDMANRFITMYPCGRMTLCEYQPIISAYYDGVTYSHKQFITANTPWNSYFYLDSGFYMQLHFSLFIKRGWAFVDSACYADGKIGGDGHALVDANYSYMTACDLKTGDYTTVLTNTTGEEIRYTFTVKNLKKADKTLYVWQTKGPDSHENLYNENQFKKIMQLIPVKNADNSFSYEITLKPYSLLTISTLDISFDENKYLNMPENLNSVMPLPYKDSFDYSDSFLKSRGNAPLYTTDQGGAFEVVKENGKSYLLQKIEKKTKASEWGGTPNPTTNFGDDRWSNYSISADITLVKSEDDDKSYAGVGLRYLLAANGESGFRFLLFENGRWTLEKSSAILKEGVILNLKPTNNLKLTADEDVLNCHINGIEVCRCECDKISVFTSGRAALYSSYNLNSFENLVVAPIENKRYYITRYNSLDECFLSYNGNVLFETISSFRNYKRALAVCKENSSVEFEFTSDMFAITGISENAVVNLFVDDKKLFENKSLFASSNRETPLKITNLENKKHSARLEILSGSFSIDSIEI